MKPGPAAAAAPPPPAPADDTRDDALQACATAAALEALSAPAFIVSAAGDIRYANARGRALADADPRGIGESLRASLAGRGERFRTTALKPVGRPPHFLIVEQAQAQDPEARLREALRRWGLTRRQGEVLARLVGGEPNKAIAAHLGCAERTVELHVTALLEKAEVSSRAELVAKFWMMI